MDAFQTVSNTACIDANHPAHYAAYMDASQTVSNTACIDAKLPALYAA